MKTDLKHWFRWIESTPWTETPLYPGRAQRPEDQAKYDAAMATRSGMSKTIYALLDWFGGLSKVVGFRWLESTPWTETPLYPGRSQKSEDRLKYAAVMANKNVISKTIYALSDCFGGLSKIYKVSIIFCPLFLLLFVIYGFICHKYSADNAKIIATLTDSQKYGVVETLKGIIRQRSKSPDFSRGAINAVNDSRIKDALIADADQWLFDNYRLDTRGSLSPLQEQAQKEYDEGPHLWEIEEMPH
jgi:hypothetical protein